ETVSVEAAPDDGWEFVEWEGDVDTDNKTLELTMDGNKSVTALFEESDTEENGTANSIEIVELPEAVGFGETFNIGLDVTRNKTQAHTVYINVRRPEDNWRVTEEVVTKVGDRTEGRNMNYSLFVPVSLDPNCDGNFSTGEYEVVAEGLGEEDRKYLEISDLEDSCEKKVEKEVVERETETVYREREFELIGHDKEVEQGAKINTEVLIRNPGNNTENFTVYSYAYDGKTPLTKGGWTGNERSIELKAEEKEILRLKNTVKDSAPVGVHDFKVRIEDEEDLESEVEIREKKNTTAEEDKEQNQTEEETVAEDKDNETEGTKETKTSATGDIYRRRGPLESIIQSLINLF
ncbi:MAG: InlB B-repeat-containing protein, partial [Candidatus Aenigmatarchaeota archaeon]